jgi:hypothetical protein
MRSSQAEGIHGHKPNQLQQQDHNDAVAKQFTHDHAWGSLAQ